MITFDEAKKLQYGDILISDQGHRWKVNGRVKTWVRSPERIRVPLKHGLYSYDFIDEHAFFDGVCTFLSREFVIRATIGEPIEL